MITVIGTMTIKPGMNALFISIFSKLATETRKEASCVSYHLFQDLKKRELFHMVGEWENEAAFDQHIDTQHFIQAMAAAGEIMSTEWDLSPSELVL